MDREETIQMAFFLFRRKNAGNSGLSAFFINLKVNFFSSIKIHESAKDHFLLPYCCCKRGTYYRNHVLARSRSHVLVFRDPRLSADAISDRRSCVFW